MNAFLDENSAASSYLITGIRGSGKTVLLRGVYKEINKRPDWIAIDLNPQGDLLSSFAEQLYMEIKRSKLPFDLSIDLSLPNVTFHLAKKNESISAESAIPELLDVLVKKGKRVLLSIDEVNKTKNFLFFANFYQKIIADGYPVFLLMSGIYENVDALISDKAASFLARTPKIVLGPLNLSAISAMYQRELNAIASEANELAKLSKGYAFAYQVIGKLCYENRSVSINDEFLQKFDEYLAENGYSVIWKNMTDGEKKVCAALAKSKTKSTSEAMKLAGMKTSNFNNFRARMLYKGYLVSDGYGKLSFTLPRFKEFVLMVEAFME